MLLFLKHFQLDILEIQLTGKAVLGGSCVIGSETTTRNTLLFSKARHLSTTITSPTSLDLS